MNTRIYKLALLLPTLIAAAQASFAQEFPTPSAEMCQKYRQGPVVHKRMPIYKEMPSADPASFYWADIWFRPEYLNSPFLDGMKEPDGLPQRDLLFTLDITTGQPVPYEYRQSADPREDNFFALLLTGGRNHRPASRVIPTRANAKMNAKWRPTGEMFHGFERVEVDDIWPAWAGQTEVFIAPAPENDLAVLTCRVMGSVPVPHCKITEKSKIFEMDYGGIRVNQLNQLEEMRQHARDFTACLSWNEGN